jgi:hypothetical protein
MSASLSLENYEPSLVVVDLAKDPVSAGGLATSTTFGHCLSYQQSGQQTDADSLETRGQKRISQTVINEN